MTDKWREKCRLGLAGDVKGWGGYWNSKASWFADRNKTHKNWGEIMPTLIKPCKRCIKGCLLPDGDEMLCINCGARYDINLAPLEGEADLNKWQKKHGMVINRWNMNRDTRKKLKIDG